MIRIVDMREATSTPNAFSVWDTIPSKFLEINGEQVFLGLQDLLETARIYNEAIDTNRIITLLPKWALK